MVQAISLMYMSTVSSLVDNYELRRCAQTFQTPFRLQEYSLFFVAVLFRIVQNYKDHIHCFDKQLK